MPEAFDTGPLSWVKDEVFQSIEKVLLNFKHVAAQPEEYPTLRFTQADLYQMSGALDMVGLEGCKRYCDEIEALISKLEKSQIPVTSAILADCIHAIEVLKGYLVDLLNGAPDTPLKLFTDLQPILAAQNLSLEESELFFPDTLVSAPKYLAPGTTQNGNLTDFMTTQRGLFQKALLDWLRLQDADSIMAMQRALKEVLSVQDKNAHISMCWAATALMDAMLAPTIAAMPAIKKVCRRLDQYLRNMSHGEYKIPAHLLRDVLYFVAISESDSPLIEAVKTHFSLCDLLPTAQAEPSVSQATEHTILARLSAEIPGLKEMWSTINRGQHSEVTIFSQQLAEIGQLEGQLNHVALASLVTNLQALASALHTDPTRLDESVLIEVAAALNIAELAIQTYPAVDPITQQKLQTQSERLLSLIKGEPLSDFSEHQHALLQDTGVVEAVATQIVAALQQVEKGLDSYFRDTRHTTLLDDVSPPLAQVLAAFEMLEFTTPAAIAKLASDYVAGFKSTHQSISSAQFELLAEGLSILRLYTEALPVVRPETTAALDDALMRMREGLQTNIDNAQADLSEFSELTARLDAMVLAEMADEAQTPTDAEVTDRAHDAELLAIFITEAEEVLATLAENIQTLRVNLTDTHALEETRRGYHTLKGSGRTIGLTGLGDVAWAVENLLNQLIENKHAVNAKQLTFIEDTTASFADWIASLQAHSQVSLIVKPYQDQAQRLADDISALPVKKVTEEVLIDGTHKISRAFFNIFMAEALQHIAVLQHAVSTLIVDHTTLPTDVSCRAAHTLGSNALTAGFKPMGDLARALEHWLDARLEGWSEADIALYQNVVSTLHKAIEKAKQYKNIRVPRALINALKKSTALMQRVVPDTVDPEAYVPTETHVLIADASALDPQAEAILSVETGDISSDPTPMVPPVSLEGLGTQTPGVDQELLSLFMDEARELLPQVGNDLRAWRNQPTDLDISDALLRALHTLKGSARMAAQSQIGDSVHAIEDLVVRALKRNVTEADFDTLFTEFDRVGSMLEDLSANNTSKQASDDAVTKPIPVTRSVQRKSQFLRLRADVLDRLINEAGEVSIMRSRMDREMQNFKQSSTDLSDSIARLRAYLRELEIEAETQLQSRLSLLQEAHEQFDPLEFDRFTRLQELTRMMAESVNDVATIQHGLLLNLDQTDAALQQQNRMNRELQQGLMSVRMLPFATIVERLQRIVRQTARELNKRVELQIKGDSIEIDRGVLEKIGAPLEHLLRNAVAHGLESPQERLQLGKPEVGQITLSINVENDEITLVITDDGAGVDLRKVKEKAIARGIFTDAQSITDNALMAVIFEPGFSTADAVSQISGRGVGLDVVRSDIASLGGRIDVSNAAGLGAMFNIYLPVTLSVAQVVMVRVGQQVFAIPSVMVEQVQKLKTADLNQAYLMQKVEWASRDYPLHYLAKLTGDHAHIAPQQDYTPVILLRSGTYRSAVHVDEVVGNLEVVMKQTGTQLSRVPGMIGATVLGDGAIVMVINPVQLANREALQVGAIKVSTMAPVVEKSKPLALVVDDSLTMRKVLSRLLEREGFDVMTANDGMDAIQKLQTNSPVIILTDIEMPRMDGFEFARHVRDTTATAHTPLIMISSRTAEKHRNVAKSLGVNVFLGKPVQDDELILQVNTLLDKSHHD